MMSMVLFLVSVVLPTSQKWYPPVRGVPWRPRGIFFGGAPRCVWNGNCRVPVRACAFYHTGNLTINYTRVWPKFKLNQSPPVRMYPKLNYYYYYFARGRGAVSLLRLSAKVTRIRKYVNLAGVLSCVANNLRWSDQSVPVAVLGYRCW